MFSLEGKPLKLARALEAAGVLIGTTPDAIDAAEDRERFQQMLNELNLKQPANRIVRDVDEGISAAEEIGYPLVVRPSYVLGGRAMEIVYQPSELMSYLKEAVVATPDSPVLLDRFLDQAIEVDVDAVSDGEQVVIGATGAHRASRCALRDCLLAAAVQLIGCVDQRDRASG